MRKQTLDLAQQAQVAACLYLGFDPHEIKYNQQLCQKSFEARPLELHLHHHHHHYMDRAVRSIDKTDSPEVMHFSGHTSKCGACCDGGKPDYFLEENRCHQEMILREMQPRTWSNSSDAYYNSTSLRCLPHTRTNVVEQDWDVGSGLISTDVPNCELGSHYYMSSSKTEHRVATSVKRKKISNEENQKGDSIQPVPVTDSSKVSCSDSRLDWSSGSLSVNSGKHLPSLENYEDLTGSDSTVNKQNQASRRGACRLGSEQVREESAGQFVLRRSFPTPVRMSIRENNVLRQEHVPEVQPRFYDSVQDKFEDDLVEGKRETFRLQNLLAQEKRKGEAYRNQLLHVQQKYKSLSEELQEIKTDSPYLTPSETAEEHSAAISNSQCDHPDVDKNVKREQMSEKSGDRDFFSQVRIIYRDYVNSHCPKSLKALKSPSDTGDSASYDKVVQREVSEQRRPQDGENDLNNLLRNFSKMLDKKLKEEMFMKVTKALASILDNGCSGTEIRALTAIKRDESGNLSNCHQTRTFTGGDPEGNSVYNDETKSSPSPSGYSNIYVSPVFEDSRRCYDNVADKFIKTPKDIEVQRTVGESNSFSEKQLPAEEGELHNLEMAVQNLGLVCQEHKQKLEHLSFGEEEHQDVKQLRDHYLAILKEIARHVNDLHFDFEEDKEALKDKSTPEGSAEQKFNVAELSEELKAKEKALHCAEELNKQLASEMSKTQAALSMLRIHCTDLQSSLEAELEEAKTDMQVLESTINALKETLTKSESKAATLEQSLAEKDSEVQTLKKKLSSTQEEADDALLEKYELVRRVHEFKKDENDQKQRINELVGINDELLVFAQGKEAELASYKNQAVHMKALQEENPKLKLELKLRSGRLEEENNDIRRECDTLRSKVEEVEYELTQREEALRRLSSQLSSAIESQDSLTEEGEQLRTLLRKAELQHSEKEDQLRQSRMIIYDLERKLLQMEEQMKETRQELGVSRGPTMKLSEVKHCDNDLLGMLQCSGEMQWRVEQLEEEILEKEGQIAILRSSFPEGYDSIF